MFKGFPHDSHWIPNGMPNQFQRIVFGFHSDFRGRLKGFPHDLQCISKGLPHEFQRIFLGFYSDIQWNSNGAPRISNGFPREDKFDITVASEIMAIFCLATSIEDLQKRRAANRRSGINSAQQPNAHLEPQ